MQKCSHLNLTANTPYNNDQMSVEGGEFVEKVLSFQLQDLCHCLELSAQMNNWNNSNDFSNFKGFYVPLKMY